MKKIILIIILLFSFNGFSQDITGKIELFENDLNHWDTLKTKKWSLKERMAFYEVNAVSIAVIKDYKIEWMKAYGYADTSEKKTATTQTLFQAASISKSINSLGILKLVEEGKLNLDVDINTYLRDWKFPYDSISKGRKISISELLSHQAGLSTSGFPGYEKGKKIPTSIEILEGKKPANSPAVRSIFEPSLKFQYSGGGTTISQLILENTSGERYEDYMQKNILNKLGMNNSFYNQPPAKEKENILATAYNGEYQVKRKFHVYPEKAAAGLWTNPTDLSKYIIETQLSLLGKSNKILSKEMSIKRLENRLGVFIIDFEGVKYFSHNGGNEGFSCFYIGSFENGDGAVIMTNSGSHGIINEISSSIASINKWRNYPIKPNKESIALTIRKECRKNISQGIEYYKKLKTTNYNEYNFSDENELNQLGYEFLRNKNVDSAFEVFNLNVQEFPNSSNVYDSRGESYFYKKDYLLAKKDYLKSLELNASNQNASEMLVKIEAIIKK